MTDLLELRRQRNAHLNRARKRRAALAKLHGVPISNVPARPIRDHLNALNGIGWSWVALSHLHGSASHAGLQLIAESNTLTARRGMQPVLRIPLTYRVPDSIPDNHRVPAGGAVRRVRAMMALGWTHAYMREASGGYDTADLARDRLGDITARNWRRVDQAFRALSARPGPSDLTRNRARRAGYVPPLAWDDIDDPNEQPKGIGGRRTMADLHDYDHLVVERILDGDWRLPATLPERLEVVARWTALGRSEADLERRTGWNVLRDKKRAAA